MQCISKTPFVTKTPSGLLMVEHSSRHSEDYPQELDVTFAPLGLFLCWFLLKTVLCLYKKNTIPSKFQQIQ